MFQAVFFYSNLLDQVKLLDINLDFNSTVKVQYLV